MDGELCLRHAYEAIFQGDFESAAGWFQQAIELEPDNASYYFRGSITYARSGKLPQALAYAERAAALAPAEPVYDYHLRTLQAKRLVQEAAALLERGLPDGLQALPLLREAARLDALSAEARLLLAIAYRQAGDERQAVAAVREALQLHPQWEDALRLLQEIRADRRRRLRGAAIRIKPRRNR